MDISAIDELTFTYLKNYINVVYGGEAVRLWSISELGILEAVTTKGTEASSC